MSGVQYFHPKVILQELSPHCDTAQLVVPGLEGSLLLHSVPVIPAASNMTHVNRMTPSDLPLLRKREKSLELLFIRATNMP